jgi:hypothetical protein
MDVGGRGFSRRMFWRLDRGFGGLLLYHALDRRGQIFGAVVNKDIGSLLLIARCVECKNSRNYLKLLT